MNEPEIAEEVKNVFVDYAKEFSIENVFDGCLVDFLSDLSIYSLPIILIYIVYKYFKLNEE